MEELADELAKNIGQCCKALLVDIPSQAYIESQVLQVEIYPYLTQEALLKLSKTLGTAYPSFSPQSYLKSGFKEGAMKT
ncbi:hypothetical protein BJV78DRAFT_1277769 [Lactifluus subvellereus]|nr:hypothetical protein BJV78DRAFT_1277769 [Lactifluus subvellereus]